MDEDYTGLGAIAWEGYASDPDPEIHKDKPMWLRAAQSEGAPILDVGCATGRILIPLCEAGYDIDGIDPSEDALAICRKKLTARGLSAKLYPQTMQTLAPARLYRLIIVPCGTIQIVIGREEQREALKRLYSALAPGGALLMTLYNYGAGYDAADKGVWKLRSRRRQPDGTELEKSAVIHDWNLLEQTLDQQVRYRLYREETLLQEQICDAPERWFYVHELTLMLERAGFQVERVTGDYTENPALPEHGVYTFWARKRHA